MGPKKRCLWKKMWSENCCVSNFCVSEKFVGPKTFGVWKMLYLTDIWVHKKMWVQKSVSRGYGSPCIHWLMITLYPLTMDHSVYEIVRWVKSVNSTTKHVILSHGVGQMANWAKWWRRHQKWWRRHQNMCQTDNQVTSSSAKSLSVRTSVTKVN